MSWYFPSVQRYNTIVILTGWNKSLDTGKIGVESSKKFPSFALVDLLDILRCSPFVDSNDNLIHLRFITELQGLDESCSFNR